MAGQMADFFRSQPDRPPAEAVAAAQELLAGSPSALVASMAHQTIGIVAREHGDAAEPDREEGAAFGVGFLQRVFDRCDAPFIAAPFCIDERVKNLSACSFRFHAMAHGVDDMRAILKRQRAACCECHIPAERVAAHGDDLEPVAVDRFEIRERAGIDEVRRVAPREVN